MRHKDDPGVDVGSASGNLARSGGAAERDMSKSIDKPAAAKRPRRRPGATGDTWQAEKSLRMRTAILEATLQCCVDVGYARTTTDKIAKEAGASLGAMMHHFKSRAEVIKAAATYVAEKRANEFDQIATEFHSEPVNVDGMHHLMERLLRYYSLPSFVALHELLVAARTDKDLQRILLPLERQLDDRIASTMRKQFPFLESIEGTRELLQDVMHFALKGLAVSPEPYLNTKRLKNMSDFLAQMAVRELTLALQEAEEAPPKARRTSGRRRAAAVGGAD